MRRVIKEARARLLNAAEFCYSANGERDLRDRSILSCPRRACYAFGGFTIQLGKQSLIVVVMRPGIRLPEMIRK
jgi:hypothetical protein